MSNIIEVSIEDLGLEEYLREFPLKVHEVADKSAAKAGRKGRVMLRDTAPKKYGDYAKGWSLRNKSTLAGGIEYVIHNRTHPHLVHLLEDGHEMFLFGHYTGKRVRPFPHFENAKEEAGDLFEQYLDDGLREIE